MDPLSRFRGSDEKDVDYWMLRRREHGSGDWMTVDLDDKDINPERIPEPLPEDDVRNRAEVEGWPPGVYHLMGVKKNKGYTGARWKFEIPEEEGNQQRELTEDEKLDRAAERAVRRAQEQGPAIDTPGKAMGAIFEATLKGEMPEGVDMGRLAEFVDVWRGMEQTAPTSPDEVAGELYQMQVAGGNMEAATAILGDWFQAQGARQGGDSMLELVQNSGDLDVSMDTIKALGMLKFLDDPRGMVRETTTGMLEAQAGAVAGRGQQQGGAGLADLFQQAGPGAEEPAEGEAAEDAPALDGEQAEPEPATGADLDLVADPEAAPDEQAAPDGAERAESAREPAGGTEAGEPTPDATTGTQGALDDALGDVEDQVDTEAGEVPSATEAMQDLQAAADEDAQAAPDGGDAVEADGEGED